MPGAVIDANVLIAVLFEEQPGLTLRTWFVGIEPVAPALWRLEVTNAILVRERQKRVPPLVALRLLKDVDELNVEIVPEPAGRSATELAAFARPHQLTSYDAVYLELAVHLGLPLFTRDGNLVAAAKRLGVTLIDRP